MIQGLDIMLKALFGIPLFSVQHIPHAQLVGWILFCPVTCCRLCDVMESEPVETGAHGDFPVCVQQIRPLTPAVKSVATHIRHLALTRPLPPSSLSHTHTHLTFCFEACLSQSEAEVISLCPGGLMFSWPADGTVCVCVCVCVTAVLSQQSAH